MRIFLNKFGNMLISRQTGKEALAAFQPTLKELSIGENLELDFDGVITFSPSWGDEFLMPLFEQLENRFILLPTDNPSVLATIELLEKIGKKKFNFIQNEK